MGIIRVKVKNLFKRFYSIAGYCKHCGCTMDVIFEVSNDLWQLVQEGDIKELCIGCFHRKASEKGIRDMAKKGVVATLLPATAFSLREPYAKGRYMIDNNCAVALATDLNPGSCFTESIPLIFALAVLYMDITTEEAVTALTINGAAALNRADTIGSIDVGKKGDVIVLEFPSYKYIPYHIGMSTVEKVVKDGNLVFEKGVKN